MKKQSINRVLHLYCTRAVTKKSHRSYFLALPPACLPSIVFKGDGRGATTLRPLALTALRRNVCAPRSDRSSCPSKHA